MVKHDFKKVNHNVSAIQQTVNEIIKFMKAEKATQSSVEGTTSCSNADDGNNGTNQNNASLTHQG